MQSGRWSGYRSPLAFLALGIEHLEHCDLNVSYLACFMRCSERNEFRSLQVPRTLALSTRPKREGDLLQISIPCTFRQIQSFCQFGRKIDGLLTSTQPRTSVGRCGCEPRLSAALGLSDDGGRFSSGLVAMKSKNWVSAST